MSGIRIIPRDEFKTTNWSGGTTTELFIFPEDASYSERRFSVRISTASVDTDESVFTSLPGVKRFLTPLSSGFDLTVNGERVNLPNGSVLEFSGEDDVICRGRGRDLNLMLKGVPGEMRLAEGDFPIASGVRAFVFAPEPCAVSYCCESGLRCTSALLMQHDFAELEEGNYHSSGRLVLFLFAV